jgi:hypothetical protein
MSEKDKKVEDKDALDALEAEAKEFDKVGIHPVSMVFLKTCIADTC